MRTKLKGQITLDDLAKLKAIHRDLQKLTVGLNPSSGATPPLMAAIAVVEWCGKEWSGDPFVFNRPHSISTAAKPDAS